MVLELYIQAEAKAGGDLKAKKEDHRYVESDEWIEKFSGVDPALLKLEASLAVGAEASLLKNSNVSEFFSVSAIAEGKVVAEIFSAGWVQGKDFEIYVLREGVWIDVKADFFVNFLGKRIEVEPYYEKIQVIDKP